MIKGTVNSYNPRRGTGYVQHAQSTDRIPFSARFAHDDRFQNGDLVEFSVVGGLAGVAARGVRRIAQTA